MSASNYQDLIVWQKAMDFVVEVYGHSDQFPDREQNGLTSQLRRAVSSIPSNIAEGAGRQSNEDFKHFLAIAHGTLREVETQLLIAERLGYLDQEDVQELLDAAAQIGRMIRGQSRSLGLS